MYDFLRDTSPSGMNFSTNNPNRFDVRHSYASFQYHSLHLVVVVVVVVVVAVVVIFIGIKHIYMFITLYILQCIYLSDI